MTIESPETTSAWSDGQASAAPSLYREGLIAGTLGAVTIALWDSRILHIRVA